MIYKESESNQYECRAPGAFVREKPFGELYPKFIFPRCAGSLCAHWLSNNPFLYYIPCFSNWKTSEAEDGREFNWVHSFRYNSTYSQDDVPRPFPDAIWHGTSLGCWKQKNPDAKGQCGLNLSSLEVNVST